MPANLLEITGIFQGVHVRFDETIVGTVKLVEATATAAAEQPQAEQSLLTANGESLPICHEAAIAPASENHTSGIVTIKGPAADGDLDYLGSYRFYGRWTTYHNRRKAATERQFAFTTFIRSQPHGRAGIIRYLQNAPHVGPARAARLFEKFQSDAVRILRESPEIAVAAIHDRQFTIERAREASIVLSQDVALEACVIDLIDLLDKRGFRKDLARQVIQVAGNKGPQFIRRDPFWLLNRFPGCGFKKCDAFYMDMGLPPAKLKRQALCAWHSLQSDSDGNTWQPYEVAKASIEKNIGGTRAKPIKALKLAKRAGRICTIRTDGINGPILDSREPVPHGARVWVAEGRRARAELYVADALGDAYGETANWPAVESLATSPAMRQITDHQMQAIGKALSSQIGLFMGGPGCGKSFCTAAIIKAIAERHGRESIGVAAPTNKAAVRLTQALEEYNVGIRATSIHSLLGVESVEGDNWRFRHGEENPLPFKFLFLDEGPMQDCGLFANVLAARARGCAVMIIGDINQLPPIQHGAPVRDMLAAGMPFGMLTEPQRNAGDVVFACQDIREGRRFRESDRIDLSAVPPKNFKIVHAGSPEQQLDVLMQVIRQQQQENGFDPIWDMQVMCALNTSGKVCRRELNNLLQRELNPADGPANSPFRVDDKVICTDNGKFPLADQSQAEPGETDDGKVFVAKGEFGRVVESQEKLVTVRFSYPDRLVKFPRGKVRERDTESRAGRDRDDNGSSGTDGNADSPVDDTGCSLELAYACTVHRMQGSETPLAIPVLDDSRGAARVWGREGLYTALSRGKRGTIAIGKRATADDLCRRPLLNRRKTFLAELLKERMHARDMEILDAILA